MKIETTGRGFVIAHFKDGNGEACSLQKSSAAERDMIWLGVDDPNPQFFPGDGTGWHPYPLPENVQCSTRMHLTRERVAELLPLLQGFVETGELVESPPKSGDGWIPVAERFPLMNQVVIVTGGIAYRGVDAKWYTLTGIAWPGSAIQWDVTHWMPLPAPPDPPPKPGGNIAPENCDGHYYEAERWNANGNVEAKCSACGMVAAFTKAEWEEMKDA